jgi:hypothetical protein
LGSIALARCRGDRTEREFTVEPRAVLRLGARLARVPRSCEKICGGTSFSLFAESPEQGSMGKESASGTGHIPHSPTRAVPAAAGGTDPVAPNPALPGRAHGDHPYIEFKFLDELKKRNVVRVVLLYLANAMRGIRQLHQRGPGHIRTRRRWSRLPQERNRWGRPNRRRAASCVRLPR